VIKQGAIVDKVICDKDIVIGEVSQIGIGDESIPNEQFPEYFHLGITVIGKDAKLGKNLQVGRNCVIYPGISVHDDIKIRTGNVVK